MDLTWTLICAVFALGVVYDVWAYYAEGANKTISVAIYSRALQYPIIPFIVGVLCGHFFWPVV
jgi:hypothetical protein